MRIALAQLNFHIGNYQLNSRKILNAIEQAKEQGADLVCFSELSTCGYAPMDLLEFPSFIDQSNMLLEKVREASESIGVLIGAPRKNPELPGKRLYNSAFLFHEKKLLGFTDKALLPTYDIFDEYRYFEPAKEIRCLVFKGKKLAVTICEDIWDLVQTDPIYNYLPMDLLMEEKPDFAINLSASPFSWAQPARRREVVIANAKKYKLPFFYINQVGGNTDLIFDGGSLVADKMGEIHEELAMFEEDLKIFDIDDINKKEGIGRVKSLDKAELIYKGLILGLKDFFKKSGFSKAILGLSGGIDSAVTAALVCDALGAENVHGLLLPSPFSSKHSIEDALQLAENLGMTCETIAIEPMYETFIDQLENSFGKTAFDTTEENIQSRIRGILLMAYSNKKGYILLNTTNKSEMAVGYGTLYGDLAGGLSVLADVYKTEVYELAAFINKDTERIPVNSILKPPSAELKPDQRDSDSLPDYDILDRILFLFIERRKGNQEIIAEGFEPETVNRVLSLVNNSEFKRYQTAPVLRVSPKSFGSGRRIPIVSVKGM
ncbi:MAG: NAD+ synthase [Saprospirales bacterium]|nr:MAG: NAD+ synthase [Saprospirales bacterium]